MKEMFDKFLVSPIFNRQTFTELIFVCCANMYKALFKVNIFFIMNIQLIANKHDR